MLPKLMKMHKWYKSDEQLVVGDIVYFQKDESVLSSVWTVGRVTEVTIGKDGAVRRVVVQFQNANENEPRFTDRAARFLLKLFNTQVTSWVDMGTFEKVVDALKKNDEAESIHISRVDHDVTVSKRSLQRGEGVQHRAVAKIMKKKMSEPCKSC